MPQVTIYLTNEEENTIKKFQRNYVISRHAFIKRAIKKMLGMKVKELHHRLPDRKLIEC